jgi:transcriptional regulator with XRE-family HTH domain
VRLRRLAAELRRLRAAAKLTHEEVIQQTGITRPTLYRIERARVRPQQRTLTTLLDLYAVSDEQHAEITALFIGAETQGWLRPSYHADLRDEYNAYIAFEAEASVVRNYESLFVPGLLQTEDYARAMTQGVWPSATTKDLEQHVQARMERQVLLTKDDPLTFTAIVDEAALRRRVGGPAVMAEQMQQLQVMAQRPNVSLQVIPYDAGAHPGMPGSFSLLSFPDTDDPEIVYIDSMANDLFLESDQDLRRYTTTFNTLARVALTPDDSLSLIAATIHELTPEQETS